MLSLELKLEMREEKHYSSRFSSARNSDSWISNYISKFFLDLGLRPRVQVRQVDLLEKIFLGDPVL